MNGDKKLSNGRCMLQYCDKKKDQVNRRVRLPWAKETSQQKHTPYKFVGEVTKAGVPPDEVRRWRRKLLKAACYTGPTFDHACDNDGRYWFCAEHLKDKDLLPADNSSFSQFSCSSQDTSPTVIRMLLKRSSRHKQEFFYAPQAVGKVPVGNSPNKLQKAMRLNQQRDHQTLRKAALNSTPSVRKASLRVLKTVSNRVDENDEAQKKLEKLEASLADAKHKMQALQDENEQAKKTIKELKDQAAEKARSTEEELKYLKQRGVSISLKSLKELTNAQVQKITGFLSADALEAFLGVIKASASIPKDSPLDDYINIYRFKRRKTEKPDAQVDSDESDEQVESDSEDSSEYESEDEAAQYDEPEEEMKHNRKRGRKSALALEVSFVMIIIYLHTGIAMGSLSAMYGIHETQGSRYLTTWLAILVPVISAIWGTPKDDYLKYMTQEYSPLVPGELKCKCLHYFYDSSNFSCDQFSYAPLHAACHSQYYGEDCLKYNVVQTHGGHLVPPSLAYPSNIGDPKLTYVSAFVTGQLKKGHCICCDKGYCIHGPAAHFGVSVITPVTMHEGTFKDHGQQRSTTVAVLRAHNERGVLAVKRQKVMKKSLQANELDIASDLVFVCAFLANMYQPLRITQA